MASQTESLDAAEQVAVFPEATIIPPRSKHTHSIILLHGRGGLGRYFGAEMITTELCSPGLDNTLPKRFPGLKFIFPTAKKTHSVQWKMYLPQWFDRGPIGSPAKEHNDLMYDGLRESSNHLKSLIDDEVKLVGAKNVVIGGFSQGCAQMLHVLLSYASDAHGPLGGLVGLSGWLPFREEIEKFIPESRRHQEHGDEDGDAEIDEESRRSAASQAMNYVRQSILDLPPISEEAAGAALSTPVWLAHGGRDMTVQPRLGEIASLVLKRLGWDVTWMLYEEIEHRFTSSQLEDLAIFLSTRVSIPDTDE